MAALRSALIWMGIALVIILGTPLVALVRLFDRDPARYRTGRWFRRVGKMLSKVNPRWRVNVTGTFPEDPRHPYVVVGNHLSNADIPVISNLPWEMKWVAKDSLLKLPFVGWMMQMAGDIPLDRESRRSGALALKQARDYLQQKVSVMFFPEGTRSLDGHVAAFSDGPFALAIKAGVPILPLAIDGTQDALPKHGWKFGGISNVHLHVFPPIPTDTYGPRDAALLREHVRQQLVGHIAAWRGLPPAEVDRLALEAPSAP